MKIKINDVELNTETDFCYKVDETLLNLSVGTIHRKNDLFYIHGKKPLNEFSVSETYTGEWEEYKIIGEDEEGYIIKGEIVKHPYEWTEYITVVSYDDVINFLIEDIQNTSLEISNANIFLGEDSIKAKGLMKVNLHDCFFYKEDIGSMIEIDKGVTINSGTFLDIENGVFNSKISNNTFEGTNKRELFPANQEYFLKVGKCDNVISSYTDKRGYIPTSCTKENADKDVIIIIRRGSSV